MAFYYSKWIELPLATRNAIASALGVVKKGGLEVVENKVIRDGYDIKDIEHAVSVDNLKKYLNTDETDYEALWGMLINKAEGREPILPTPNLDTTQPLVVAVKPLPADLVIQPGKITVLPVENLTPEEVKVPIKKVNKGGRPKGSKNKPKAPVM